MKTASQLLKRHTLLTCLAEISGETPVRIEEDNTVISTENYTLLVDLHVKSWGKLLIPTLFSASLSPCEVIAK